MSICVFCKTEGNFYTKEHIVPESLGNDTDILKNVICEKCQNYFGREIEKPTLEKTNLAFWRSYLGIRTKRNHLPSVNLDPPVKGAIPSFHPATEFGIGFTAHEDGSTSIDLNNPGQEKGLLREQSEYRMILTPWHLSILGRFLGKMGLEFIALSDIDYALNTEFDRIRSFVRFGDTKHLWPIYWGQQGKLSEIKHLIIWDALKGQQEIECYRYSLGKKITGEMVFIFSIGIDIMEICLSKNLPDPDLEECVQDTKMACVYYADGTW